MRQAAQCRYLDRVPTDPAPFLSTIILASAALVAIIGGLLVARFVGLDSDQQSSRRVLSDAAARLASARRRAAEARGNLVAWEARSFLSSSRVLNAIGRGYSDLQLLRRLGDCPLSDEELRPFVAEVADEFTQAREVLTARVSRSSDTDWGRFRLMTPDLPKIRWPQIWEGIFDEIVEKISKEAAREEAAKRRAVAQSNPRSNPAAGLFASLPEAALQFETWPLPRAKLLGMAATDTVTRARRYDELVAANERAQQRVEDYEDELRRLRQEHREIVRPHARLWWAVGILTAFTIVGVGVPAWLMSEGPGNLGAVQWLVYPFAGALAALLIYIVVYLAQLTRRRAPSPSGDEDNSVTPGS